jgi:hypothetical protein
MYPQNRQSSSEINSFGIKKVTLTLVRIQSGTQKKEGIWRRYATYPKLMDGGTSENTWSDMGMMIPT